MNTRFKTMLPMKKKNGKGRGEVHIGLNCLKILFLNMRNYDMDIHYKISMNLYA